MFSSIVWESLAILQQASLRAKLRKIFHGKSFLPFLTSCTVVIPPGCEYLCSFHWLSSKNDNVVENRSGSLPEVLDVTALRELVTGNLEKLDRNSGRGKSMYHIFHLLMDSYFLASERSKLIYSPLLPFVQPSLGLG